jgi:dTDP-4-amino-4,6-dideoxygalactose transaminase
MWVRTQLKIKWSDLVAGVKFGLSPPDRKAQLQKAEAYFGGDSIAAYSVRSGFDLLLQALDLKPGDEVIFSALNVKGMVRVVREAGLVPVPVDLEIAHMGPSLERLQAAITPRSKVFVVAHLFGARLALDPLFALARSKGIIAVEDCAQAFNGRDYPGSSVADVNMFSFGPIKTATALGGALIRVKDAKLRERMRTIQATYPLQPDKQHLKRVLQFMGLKIVTVPWVLAAIFYMQDRKKKRKQASSAATTAKPMPPWQNPQSIDLPSERTATPKPAKQVYEDRLADLVRDVAPLKTAANLRQQPSAAMLALMNRRLEQFDANLIRERTRKGELLRDQLNGSVVMPAQRNAHHDYWVFPLLVNEPRKFIEGLRAEGFDASDLPRSQHIAAPADRPSLEPKIAAKVMKDLIVVPCYDAMPDRELLRMAKVIRKIASGVAPRAEL